MRLYWVSVALWAATSACGIVSDGPKNGSETHFLTRCLESCGHGLECLEGVCTKPCEEDLECGELNAEAACADANGSCQLVCGSDQECTAVNDDFLCAQGFCRSSSPPRDCPVFPGGMREPEAVEATMEPIPQAQDVGRMVADADGLYWMNDSGAVYALPESSTDSIELSPAPEDPVTLMGIVTDETMVFFADAGFSDIVDTEGIIPPPGRLYAVPKSGGAPELLIELEDAVLEPLAMTDSGLVVRSEGFLYLVTDGEMQQLEHIPRTSDERQVQIHGGTIYFIEFVDIQQPTELLAFDLSGGEPETVGNVSGAYWVREDRVFWKQRVSQRELIEQFLMQDLQTGCRQELPHLGESTGAYPMIDSRHIYWKSFDGLGSSDCQDPKPLVRVDLSSGAFERVTTPGFDVTLCTDFLAQDEETLYIRTWQERSLFALRKPE